MHRLKPTPALIVAGIALVMAMTGGALAAGKLIDGKQIKKNSIAANKLTAKAKQQLRGARGPKGAKGATGATGAQGAKGDTGLQGPAGKQGPKGDVGAVGPQGPKGDTGATGPAGPNGDTGATGPEGPAGPKGDKGDTGEQGLPGPQGPIGPKGDQGEPGPTEENYGLAGVFVDSTRVATVYTPTIPLTGHNAAMTAGTAVIPCAEATCELSLQAAVRSKNDSFAATGGGAVVVTNAVTGELVAAGQTDATGVPVQTEPVDTPSPELTSGMELPIEWSNGETGKLSLPTGEYIVQGTAEFFHTTS